MVKTKISRFFKIRAATDLMNLPVIVTVNKFDEAATKEFKEGFHRAQELGQPIIPIVIDSYGGQVYSLLSMIDTLSTADVPVATIITGKAMSCGAVLFTCGTEGQRYMGPNATLMIHDVSSGVSGKVKDMKIDLKEAERLNEKIYEMMAKNCGKDPKYFNDIVQKMARTDWFLTPDEALKHNIANEIRIPKLMVKASVSIKLV